MTNLTQLKTGFENFLYEQIAHKEPENLYVPILYSLQNGGKRIRPILVLLSAKSFGVSVDKALPAAAAIEIFHNFTLLHDDIMDQAPLRRGKPTVYRKWDENTAILSGDTMLVLAYKMLEAYDDNTYKQLNVLLNQTAVEVCEGQQMDMDFETRDTVSIKEYIEMIRLKTAVLLGAALRYGGIIAQTSDTNLRYINDFGVMLGLAFQIQDDYLDTFGNTENFGKRIGGDILDRKKTYLYLTALQQADEKDKQKLLTLYHNQDIKKDILIEQVITLFKKYKVDTLAKEQINYFTQKSLQALENTSLSKNNKDFWKNFAYQLMHRAS